MRLALVIILAAGLAGCDQVARDCIARGGSWVVVGWGQHMRYGKPAGTYPVYECRMPGVP